MKSIFLSCLMIFSLSAFAQDGTPPPLNPYDSPWGSPSADPIPPSGSDSGSSSPPPSDPFGSSGDGFTPPGYSDDEDAFGDFSGGKSSGGGKGEGKNSFMLVEPSNVNECSAWGNSLLIKKDYKDFNDCQFQLERKLEQTRAAIEKNIDQVERHKLKKMLRGKINNDQRKQNQLQFSKLQKRLKTETKNGCACQKK